MIESCTTPDCDLADHQCPVCRQRFVKQAQEVCATCRPWACENCGKVTRAAHVKTKSPAEIATEVRILMGYGTSIGRCLTCETIKAIGDMGICQECVLKKITESELVCEDCLHEDSNSAWMPEGRYPGSCRDCGDEKLLNEEYLCKRCYDKQNFKGLTYTPSRRCWNCHEVFLVQRQDQHFCNSCAPKCYGCGGKFDPYTRDESFCENCLDRLASHQCTNCGSDDMFLDDRGYCSGCANFVGYPRQPYFCKVCEITEVDSYGQVCSGCQHRIKNCPRCYTNKIEAKEYICDSCKGEKA